MCSGSIIGVFFVVLVWEAASVVMTERLFEGEAWESGSIDIGDSGNSLFYLMFRSRSRSNSAPLVLYLCGGPGATSLFSLGMQNGPYVLTPTGEWVRNVHSLNNLNDVVYLDQPAGVGFSRANRFCDNGTCVANGLRGSFSGSMNCTRSTAAGPSTSPA